MILLSVHLITYNNEKHINDTLQSILKQKVNFIYEIVVGDDCSTDSTYNIIRSYQENHPEIFKIKKNNEQLGIYKNFKTTLDRCSGKYIFDIAGDDLLKSENALQKMVDIFEDNPGLGFIDSGFDSLNELENKTYFFKNKNKINCSTDSYKEQALLGLISPIGLCYNKEKLYKYVDFDTYLNMGSTIEDYPIIVDMIMNTNFKRINQSLHTYRVYEDSYSHEKNFKKTLFLKNQMKNLFDFFKKKYNLSNKIIDIYNENHFRELLFFAAYFEKKAIGKETFTKLRSKKLKDYIHYFASQNKIFRKLVSLF